MVNTIWESVDYTYTIGLCQHSYTSILPLSVGIPNIPPQLTSSIKKLDHIKKWWCMFVSIYAAQVTVGLIKDKFGKINSMEISFLHMFQQEISATVQCQ